MPKEMWSPRIEDTIPELGIRSMGSMRFWQTKLHRGTMVAEEAGNNAEHKCKQEPCGQSSVADEGGRLGRAKVVEVISLLSDFEKRRTV